MRSLALTCSSFGAIALALSLGSLSGCSRGSGPGGEGGGPAASAPASASAASGTVPAAPALDRAALLRGELPAGPETEIVRSRCQICHTLEYVTQQRLTEPQWEKTLAKMQKWGSPITDEERKRLAPYLAAVWPKELDAPGYPRVATPPGAVPAARAR